MACLIDELLELAIDKLRGRVGGALERSLSPTGTLRVERDRRPALDERTGGLPGREVLRIVQGARTSLVGVRPLSWRMPRSKE
jgi:hypothetical protein